MYGCIRRPPWPFSLWCCYRLLHLRLPVPTIVITVITIVNILTGLHRLQSESNAQRRDHTVSPSLLCIIGKAGCRRVWRRISAAHLPSGRAQVRILQDIYGFFSAFNNAGGNNARVSSAAARQSSAGLNSHGLGRGVGFAPALFLLFLAVTINYIDRGNLSIAAPLLKAEWHLNASMLERSFPHSSGLTPRCSLWVDGC